MLQGILSTLHGENSLQHLCVRQWRRGPYNCVAASLREPATSLRMTDPETWRGVDTTRTSGNQSNYQCASPSPGATSGGSTFCTNRDFDDGGGGNSPWSLPATATFTYCIQMCNAAQP